MVKIQMESALPDGLKWDLEFSAQHVAKFRGVCRMHYALCKADNFKQQCGKTNRKREEGEKKGYSGKRAKRIVGGLQNADPVPPTQPLPMKRMRVFRLWEILWAVSWSLPSLKDSDVWSLGLYRV